MAAGDGKEDAGAVVVGGGPAGLAVALSLASLGYDKIVVLEKADRSWDVDWVKSYCYRIDGHGLACPMSNDKQRSYWLQRGDLLELLHAEAQAQGVDVRFGCAFVGLNESSAAGGVWEVLVEDEEGSGEKLGAEQRRVLRAPLVVGADGAGSRVRRCLEARDPAFTPVTLPHVTTGKHFKALRLLVPGEVAPSGVMAMVKGRDGARLSFFPQRADRHRVVGAGSLGRKSFADGADLRSYLEGNFPTIDWSSALEDSMADQFASHPGSWFPEVRFLRRLQLPAAAGRGGVALVGDAVHVFPPDLGQGVNAALEDVAELHRALLAAGSGKGPDTIAAGLQAYEDARLPDAQAVAHLLPIGAPYQYGQPGGLEKVRWYADFMARMAANRLAPSLFNPPIVFSLQDPQYSYSQLLQMHNSTTRSLLLAGAAIGLVVTASAVGVYSRLAGRSSGGR
eukprot:jgi/Tetstr1/433316/TSEL_022603.t1